MLNRLIRLVGGDPNKREVDRTTKVVDEINSLEAQFEALSDDELRLKTSEFKARLAEAINGISDESELYQAEKAALDEILPEAFAAVREASKRTLGLRHYDVQMIGGITLHNGKISEMRTGEGKTLVATLPLYLNSLAGHGVHLITVNDYLARRDARWMAPIFNLLGMSVGVLQMAARTENGKKAFLVDLEREAPHEDQHQLRMTPRGEAYLADITYGTNSEFGFDYLRDNMTLSWEDRVQRGHYYAIVDEVDNVLIDEARTPLIISGPAQDEGEWYVRMAQVVRQLKTDDYEVNEKDRSVTLSELGEAHVEELLEIPLRDPERPEDVTPEQARLLGYLEQALRAQYLFKKNKDYLVQSGKVIIVDEFTGRMMPGRRWSDGLHQAVEAKEGVRVQSESVTYATITIQNYFRMYKKLAGMSGTAITEAEEFDKIYKLGVLNIPTNLEFQAMRPESGLTELDGKDEQGYKFQYYARKDNTDKTPLFWRRKDFPDVVYRTVEAKLRAISGAILVDHVLGRPLLVGTTSVESSERLSTRLKADPLRRLAQVTLLRDCWMRRNNREDDGRAVAELQFLNLPLLELDTNAMRKLARDLDIPFNPEEPENLSRLAGILEIPPQCIDRLAADLQAGIKHQVLNARKHDEESKIIENAGAFGSVTIATNMAGRGVDIKLGGDLPERTILIVNRVLKRAGYADPYDMTMLERHDALKKMDPADYGIYGAEIQIFMTHMDEMEQVRRLGGLHVIGTERHEARRIDNQLRGRSARQGDPGSSRFYLSMEDDLMRMFGGQQADSMMQRLKLDDAMPLELGLVGRLVEQSQTRVEGANFDMRKHLLEYDDVLNSQRAAIYTQRDRIFTKDDLTEDVADMLSTELSIRVPEAFQDEGGPWKLLSWLDQVQPTLNLGNYYYPSYGMRQVLNKLKAELPAEPTPQQVRPALLASVDQALKAEHDHLMAALREALKSAGERLEGQVDERLEALDTFFDGLANDEMLAERRPVELQGEMNEAVRLQIKLTPDQQRQLRDAPKALAPLVRQQVEQTVRVQYITRTLAGLERRLEEPLDMNPAELTGERWQTISQMVLEAAESALQMRQERFIGENGQITRDVDNIIERLSSSASEPHPVNEQTLLVILMQLTQGSRAAFDRRTHRRVFTRTTRLSYIYSAAREIEDRKPEEITEDVMEHLEGARVAMQRAWGVAEVNRLAGYRPLDLDETTRRNLLEALEIDKDSPLAAQPIAYLPPEKIQVAIEEMGRRALTGIYRQVLLGVITELWVDYLTNMEALRVSIGLEAYAQRDPLVQYKSKASELYRTLLRDIRTSVIGRMFTYRLRDPSSVTAAAPSEPGRNAERLAERPAIQASVPNAAPPLTEANGAEEDLEPTVEAASSDSEDNSAGKKKRKRH
jgi:preprotein translocase subunit SecA